ncbi:hypothetical protein HHI36_014196 [Cryptolaemus montrouzieri]|uniref:E3 ubiquitin-protein ligase n=1 Tax=Cryptolaemus montrouzieri TaxID=559131 RepID=A0ABD2N351_9CUCU
MGTRIPLWLLQDLKCRHCKNFLSCGPVYVAPDLGLLCGRCRALAKPNFRNYVYEELASAFQFPCMYWEKHCPKEGAWNTLREHELDCSYKSSCGLICMDMKAFFATKRVLPNDESLLYLEVPENCLNLVCCKNCGKYLSCEPVHINVVGSNICHRCYLSNGIPPHTLRNLAYEKLANIFRFPCIFRAKGCPIKMKFGRDSWEHEVGCHYRDVQIPSIPSTPSVNPNYVHPLSGIDNSGYRPSYEDYSATGDLSMYDERQVIELPRLSSILKKERIEREIEIDQQKKLRDLEITSKIIMNFKNQNDTKPNLWRDAYKSIKKESNINQSDKERIADKEKGVVPTHTGHVYATLTQNSVLFAPPQLHPNKDPTDGIKVTKEFQDKLRRNASNVSQNGSARKTVADPLLFSKDNETIENPKNSASVAKTNSLTSFDIPILNKNRARDLENYSPVVKEYVLYNPQNNVQRNESLTIGNASIIAELKVRQEQRNKKRQDENFNNIEVH